MTRSEKAGKQMAENLIEWLHLMYQRDTQIRILDALVKKLTNQLTTWKSLRDEGIRS